MRFAFVGGLDVPDWLLSEVFVLSKISAVRIKLLCKHVVERELGRTQEDKVGKLLGESKLDEAGVKAVVAAVQFILSAAARHDVAEEVLAQELQQLGLPREHTDGLVNAFRDGRAALRQHYAAQSLRLPRLQAVGWELHADPEAAAAHGVDLQLRVQPPPGGGGGADGEARTLRLALTADMFTLLYRELKAARDAMAALPQ